MSLGKHLSELKITKEQLLNKDISLTSDLTNGIVLDLYSFCVSENLIIKDYLFNWISLLTKTNIHEINKEATLSKIHRTIKLCKSKRGLEKNSILCQKFLIPVQVPSASTSSFKPIQSEEQRDQLRIRLQERRETLNQTREKSKQLKRKLERLERKSDEKKAKLAELNSEVNSLKKEKTVSTRNEKLLQQKIRDLSARNARSIQTIKDLKGSQSSLKQELSEKEEQLKSIQEVLNETGEIVSRVEDSEKELNEAHKTVDYLTSLINDTTELELFDETEKKYSNETVQCIMNLTDLKVPTEKVGSVIKEVTRLCGKKVNRVPSASTVNRIVDSKVALAETQVGSLLKDKPHTTLYTDETRKFGKCMQTYLVTDEDQKSYLLGLREMVDKSGQSTLDTLKEILNDITEYCHVNEINNDINVGNKLLANIRDTMSDRASTEKNFNNLLEHFRTQILPDVIDDWPNLSDQERSLCANMNNFFCGLHLLVGIADTCESTLKVFEKNYLDGKDIGSGIKPELKKYHRNESGTLRLLRTVSKCFAIGEDEKNGFSLPWITYLKSKGEKNHIVRFKHNRFNLVFSLASATYFHKEHISVFLNEVHGLTNDLAKAVSLDINESLYMAGLKAFGLISKQVTGPLWRLLETKGPILEMNAHYKQLTDFLKKGADNLEDIEKFIEGEASPFNTLVGNDVESVKLFEKNDEIDEVLYPLLQGLFLSIHELLNRMVADHLLGGKFYAPSDKLVAESKSTMKHNKLPEFIFGQLDQLLRYRPNATLLTNEAYLLYSHNKTRQWLESLSPDEKDRLLTNIRKEGKDVREKFKERLKLIEAKRLEIQQERRRKLEESERKRIQNMEEMTNAVCYYGLWQSQEQVNEGLAKLKTDKEQREALQSQLKFRKKVLNQKHSDSKIFNFSEKVGGKYQKLTIEQLKSNVFKLIQDCLMVPTEEKHQSNVPLLVGKKVSHKFSDGAEYIGTVISVVPGFCEWYNIKYQNDEAIYAYNLAEDYRNGDLKLVL